MKSRSLLWSTSLFLLVSTSILKSQEPTIENVRFIQRADSKVEISYDLIGNPAKKYYVSVSLVQAGSRRPFLVSWDALLGDVEKVYPGRGLKITWNLPKDYPRGLEGDRFVFAIDAGEQKERNYLGNNHNKGRWSVGARLGYHEWQVRVSDFGFQDSGSSFSAAIITQVRLSEALEIQSSFSYRGDFFERAFFPWMVTGLLYPLPALYTGIGLGFDLLDVTDGGTSVGISLEVLRHRDPQNRGLLQTVDMSS